MRVFFILGAVALAIGCGGSDGHDEEEEEPITCSASDRSGTYLLTYEYLDGDCGDVPSQVVRLDPNEPLPAACVLDAADAISEDWCVVERSATCTDPETGARTRLVAQTTQQNDSGSLITGIASFTVFDDIGPVCTGTYRLRYQRQ